MEMSKGLGKEYSLQSLLAYAAPTIGLMVFMSIYTMIDGIFVARYVSATALSAINIFFPLYGLVMAIALMLGTGGSAIIARKMGEDNDEEARRNFTFIVSCGTAIGFVILVIGLLFITPILEILGAGATEELFNETYIYGKIMLMTSPLIILQMLFQLFFVTAGKPNLGLTVTFLGGVANIVLDYVFIVEMQMGIAGAAIATAIGIAIPALFGLVYFSLCKESSLYFVRPRFEGKVLLSSCINGSSEMVSNLASSVVTVAFNLLLLKYIGVDGVAAVTIMLYVMFILAAVFMGYSAGIAPIISYKFGRKDEVQLQKIFTSSLLIVSIGSIIVYVLALLFGPYFIQFMAAKGSDVYNIAVDGFIIFGVSFLFMGMNIFISMLFTALSNGKVSATISLLRTFVFVIVGLFVLPLIMGVNGIWLAVPVAEFLSILVCACFLFRQRKFYHYF
ncbi:MATE family efflux transporter [Alkalihalobacillus sp. LMS39]|uniref:MATE family efflux transporter n=1 Tax=Alkalihalobacillus sp. LMS39 TaxID=2924032 RepID=UPI001FB4B8B8|nr:MATE family efflux transporter [Alkalihalobacillus sp. LMS39]UOE95289.1 MATE family efflux transporter [Alkalihalobacillus sp. LMS39]